MALVGVLQEAVDDDGGDDSLAAQVQPQHLVAAAVGHLALLAAASNAVALAAALQLLRRRRRMLAVSSADSVHPPPSCATRAYAHAHTLPMNYLPVLDLTVVSSPNRSKIHLHTLRLPAIQTAMFQSTCVSAESQHRLFPQPNPLICQPL